MNSTLRRYPRFLFQLCLLLLVQGVAQHFVHISKVYQEMEAALPETSSRFLQLLPLPELMFIIAGLFADRIKNVRYGLQVSLAVMLLGSVAVNLANPYLSFFGRALVDGGSAVITLIAFLHIAVWYPIAHGEKDNAFILLALPSLLMGLAGLAAGFIAYSGSAHLLNIAFVALCLLAGIFIVSGSRDIGFEVVPSEAAEPEQPLPWGILWVFTAFSVVMHLAYFHFKSIGEGWLSFFGDEPYTNVLIYLVVVLLIFGFAWVLLDSPSKRPSQIRKVWLGMFALLGVAMLEFGVKASSSFELDTLSNTLSHAIYTCFLLPFLLSALTHVNFDRHAGLWLGICIGVPGLVSSILSNFVQPHVPLWVLPVISGVLLIIGIIWLRENEAFVRDTLRLEEPNQEVEEEEEKGGDPLDHLVEQP